MGDLENKMLVQHVSLGLGKVVALEPNAVHVFFPDSDKRFAAKLRLPGAKALLRIDGVERNTWLEGLSAFSLDEKTGRYALAATWLSHDDAIAQFLQSQPQGFAAGAVEGASRKGAEGRAAPWRAAHEAWCSSLGDGEGERLVADDDVRELVKRALKVEHLVASLNPSAEAGTLKEALHDVDASRGFFRALFEVLGVPVPGRARFEKLFSATLHLPGTLASKWPIATLFPFVAQPERHVFLRPKPMREAAERLGCDLRFNETPNWPTYAALRGLSAQLLEELKASGARDFIDVETFLHATGAKRAPGAKVRAVATRTRSTP
jgi:hypothetical protein